MRALARLFGVEGYKQNSTDSHHRLGQAIYGEGYPEIPVKEPRPPAVETTDAARTLIQTTYTAQQWFDLPWDGRGGDNIAGTGRGMRALARLFGVEGYKQNSTDSHHRLGQAIYGEGYPKQ